MVVQITLSVGWFALILFVVLFSFSLSFFLLYRAGTGIIELPSVIVDDATEYTVEDEVYGYDTWYTSFLAGFASMLGEFDLEEFESSANKNAMTVLFTIFQFFVNIVMLNLLIAIMGDQYDVVQESGHEQYLYAKAGIILKYEERMSRATKQNPKLFPEWLQLLQPKTDDDEAQKGYLSMTGRVKNHISEETRALGELFTKEMREMRDEMAELNAKLNAIAGP